MFPWRKEVAPEGKMIVVSGYTIEDRLRALCLAATISVSVEKDAAEEARRIRAACSGGSKLCLIRGAFSSLRSLASYDQDEGVRFGYGSDFDVFRTFRRLKSTGKADCDCYVASLCGLLSCLGVTAGGSAIEQWVPEEAAWMWTHVFGRALDDVGRIVPLELTPVPPDGHLAAMGYETPSRTYRRRRDFWFNALAWSAWLRSQGGPRFDIDLRTAPSL